MAARRRTGARWACGRFVRPGGGPRERTVRTHGTAGAPHRGSREARKRRHSQMKQPYIRPGIDDRPDLDKALTPEDKKALARLAVRVERDAPESSVDMTEAQATRLAAASSPASAAASVDAPVPDLSSSFLDMRDPMVAADGERPDRTQVRRLTWGFALSSALTALAWTALVVVGLPGLVARLVGATAAPLDVATVARLARDLAVVLGVGAVVSLLVSPVVAAYSDATRVSLGRRTPWILGGGVLAALFVVILGAVDAVGGLVWVWAVVCLGRATMTVPLDASFSERMPDKFRVAALRWRGIARMVGDLLGIVVGAVCYLAFGRLPYEIFAVCAVAFLAAAILAVAVTPREPSSEGMAQERVRSADLLGRLRFPRRAPRFVAMFASRLCMAAAVGTPGMVLWYVVRYRAFDDAAFGARHAGLSAAIPAAGALAVIALAAFLGAVAAALLAGPIAARVTNRRLPVVLSCALTVVAMGIPALVLALIPLDRRSGISAGVLVALGAFVLLSALATGLSDALGQDLAMGSLPDPHTAARDLGVLTLAYGLGTVVAAVLVAWTLSAGLWAAPFVAAAVLAAVGALCASRA